MTKDEFLLNLTRSGVTLVKYEATWCAPCRQLKPFAEAAAEQAGIRLVNVDIDEASDLCLERKVRTVPTLQVVRSDGSVVASSTGVLSKEAILKMLETAK